MAELLFNVDIQSSREAIPSLEEKQLVYLLIDIQPTTNREFTSLPLNLCLLIDKSSSMHGERLEHVRGAASAILEKLSKDDIVSIVAFSETAEVILPAQHIESRREFVSIVGGIDAAGGTEMLSGLICGIQQLRQVSLANHNNHLILLTDGHTYGDEKECISLIRAAAADGIDFSAFGLGAEWNDGFLDRLVAYSGGQSAFIESPEKVIEQVERRFDGIGRIYAQNVRLRSDFPSNIHLQTAFKVAPFAQRLSPKKHVVHFGSVEGRRPLSVLLEFLIEPQQVGHTVTIPLVLIADIPSRFIRDKELKLGFELDVVEKEPELKPSIDLLAAVQAVNFHQMNELAWKDIQHGQVQQAVVRLHFLATRLLEAGHAQMGQRVLSEAERVMTWGSMSGEGRKALKYGTRALLSQSRLSETY